MIDNMSTLPGRWLAACTNRDNGGLNLNSTKSEPAQDGQDEQSSGGPHEKTLHGDP
jgi:hypothetical protein